MISRSGDWITADVGGDLVMMSVTSGRYVALGGIGGRIWELIERPCSADDLCRQLVQEFDVTDAVCRSEVTHFLEELRRVGAVVFDDA